MNETEEENESQMKIVLNENELEYHEQLKEKVKHVENEQPPKGHSRYCRLKKWLRSKCFKCFHSS